MLFRTIATYRSGIRPPRTSTLFSTVDQLSLHEAETAWASVDRYFVGSMAVGRVQSTGHDTLVREPLGASLVVPLHGRIQSKTGKQILKASPGEALLFSPNRRLTRVAGTGGDPFVGAPMIIPAGDLKSAADRMGVRSSRMPNLDNFALSLTSSASAQAREIVEIARVIYGEVSRGSPRMLRAESHSS